MYDHEKSDPAIVAVKPTNKAGQPAAELVEPRAGAEGNVRQQSTGRAQYRETVSQALKRIRNFVRISRRAVTYPRWEPLPELGSHGSVRGARGNSRPYRESDWHTVKVTRMTLNGLHGLFCRSRQRPTLTRYRAGLATSPNAGSARSTISSDAVRLIRK